MTFPPVKRIGDVLPMGGASANTIPTVWTASTDDHALLRLPWRDREPRNIRGDTAGSDRFNCDYSRPGLEDLAKGIHRLGCEDDEVNVIFNNNSENQDQDLDQDQHNAGTMIEVLR